MSKLQSLTRTFRLVCQAYLWLDTLLEANCSLAAQATGGERDTGARMHMVPTVPQLDAAQGGHAPWAYPALQHQFLSAAGPSTAPARPHQFLSAESAPAMLQPMQNNGLGLFAQPRLEVTQAAFSLPPVLPLSSDGEGSPMQFLPPSP